jgi:pilin isopeptide linkage protein
MEVVKMKKSKKFLSMLLAVTMACSMIAVSASADGETDGTSNTNNTATVAATEAQNASTINMAEGSTVGLKEIDFTKVLETGSDVQIMTNTTFTFTMEGDDVPAETKASLDYMKGTIDSDDATKKLTTTGSVTADSKDNIDTYYNSTTAAKEAATKAGAAENAYTAKVVPGLNKESVTGIKLDLKFDLSELSFTKSGVYRYLVQEVPDEMSKNKTIVYDTTKFIVDLYVGNVDGNYIIESAVSQTQAGTKKPIVFNNTFLTSSIKIEKQIDGTQAKDTDEFTFWIKIPEGGTSIVLEKGKTIEANKTESGQEPVPVTSITVGGSMTQEDYVEGETQSEYYDPENTTNENDNGWCSFTLKGGQALEITGIPASMVYYLFEEDYQSQGYETTHIKQFTATTPAKSAITLQGGDLGKLTTEQGVNYIGFLNTKNTNPGTGVTMDILPYAVVVLAAVAAFAVLLISKKRRNAR